MSYKIIIKKSKGNKNILQGLIFLNFFFWRPNNVLSCKEFSLTGSFSMLFWSYKGDLLNVQMMFVTFKLCKKYGYFVGIIISSHSVNISR